MKKYIKPELFFESFELSQQIAACDFDSNNTQNDEQCFFTGTSDYLPKDMTITIFQSHCEASGGVGVQEYCYHNASLAPFHYGIFNS